MLFSILQNGYLDPLGVLMDILAVAFVIVCILPLHEFAHGWVAYKLGDPTAKNSGRLTLNPVASFDKMGALAILLLGFGWAKPVPVDMRYFKKPKRDMAIVGAAGPISNLLAAFVGAFLIYGILAFSHADTWFVQLAFGFLGTYISINISLAVFNLIPIPPLDGSRILGAFLPNKILYRMYQYERYLMIGVLLIMMFGLLNGPLQYFNILARDFILTAASLPYRLFGLI